MSASNSSPLFKSAFFFFHLHFYALRDFVTHFPQIKRTLIYIFYKVNTFGHAGIEQVRRYEQFTAILRKKISKHCLADLT